MKSLFIGLLVLSALAALMLTSGCGPKTDPNDPANTPPTSTRPAGAPARKSVQGVGAPGAPGGISGAKPVIQ